MDLSGMDKNVHSKVHTANIINYLACVIHQLTGAQPWIAFDTDEILRYAGEHGIEGIEVELKRNPQGSEEVVLTYVTSRPSQPKRRGFKAIDGGRE